MGKLECYKSSDYQLGKLVEKINDIIRIRKITKGEFAILLGMPRATIAKYFSNANLKSIPTYIVKNISDKFEIPLDELLIPVNNDDKSQEIYAWVKKDVAMPYLRKAYQEYLNDIGKKVLSNIK